MTPRDPVREALVSVRTAAYLAWMYADEVGEREYEAYHRARRAVEDYDARTTPAASSDAGAQDKR